MANKTVIANFTANVYNITASAEPSAGGKVICTPNPVEHGKDSTCMATANEGYRFDFFKGDCSDTNCVLRNVTSAKTVTAFFSSADMYAMPSLFETYVQSGKTASFTVTGGAAPYSWRADSGVVSPTTGTTVGYTPSSKDDSVTVTDNSQRTAKAMIKIWPKLNVSPLNASAGCKELLNFSITGGKPDYSVIATSGTVGGISASGFSFTTPSVTSSVNLTITDNLVQSQVVRVDVHCDLKPKVMPETVYLSPKGYSNDHQQFSASGGTPPYNWSARCGTFSASQGSPVVYYAPSTKGECAITVTDSSNATAQATVTIDYGNIRITPAISSTILGDNSAITLDAIGGIAPFVWSADAGKVAPTTETSVNYLPPARVGEYTVNVEDGQNLFANATVRVVTVPALTPSQVLLKPKDTATFRVVGGAPPYTWTAERGTLSAMQGSVISHSAPDRLGEYSVTVTDSANNSTRAMVQVYGDCMITPFHSVTIVNEPVQFAAVKGVEPLIWPDNSAGRTWQTRYTTLGKQEVILQDSAGCSAVGIVEVIQGSISVSPQMAYLAPGEVTNFAASGGTGTYTWTAQAGTLGSQDGTRASYQAPSKPGIYVLSVTDSAGVTGYARMWIGSDVIKTDGSVPANPGKIYNGMKIDDVPQATQRAHAKQNSPLHLQFSVHVPDDGQQYNVYAAVMLSENIARQLNAPPFVFRTNDSLVFVDLSKEQPLPVYAKANSGETLTVDFFKGALQGLPGNYSFYLGYAPVGTDSLSHLSLNSEPFVLEVNE